MKNDFLRAVAASPRVFVGDVDKNIDNMIEILKSVKGQSPDLVVFPELSVTGYTCGDLFHNWTLLEGAVAGLERFVREYPREIPLVLLGMPIRVDGAIYNCAVGVSDGKIVGLVPKTYIPDYNEFYERRWFASGHVFATPRQDVPIGQFKATIGSNLLFDLGGVKIGVEICEDLWVPVPPSCSLAMRGAEVIVNLSASDDIIGKYSYLKSLISQQSARCVCGYVYASAGYGESSTDLVFDGKDIICENGNFLAEGNRFERGNKYVIADIDIEGIRHDRFHLTTFADCADINAKDNFVIAPVPTSVDRHVTPENLLRKVDPHPFVPSDPSTLAERCEEILHIQESGLCKRLEATGCKTLIVGISGGLDSTLALLVAIRAFDTLNLDRKGIVGITMPGFGTTGRTHRNALSMMEAIGVTILEIPIAEAVNQHFKDIGHDGVTPDITYENAQARERTQILMDVANKMGGMVLGTGDLSELALGWATYNGDHISMYGVNAGVPKTLVRHLVKYMAGKHGYEACNEVLTDILSTPISPELIPADKQGNISQKTEDLVGPYELHDFFLYRMLRHGEKPERILLLAKKAFKDIYDDATIAKWLRVFLKRFFSQQFKRSCLPDGPKIGSVTLSPRGDWRMPSDASVSLWLD